MKNISLVSFIILLLSVSMKTQAALSLEFSFSPFIEETSIDNIHVIASSSNLAYYNYSTINYSAPSALIYRFEDGGLVQEANLFYLLSPRSCNLSKFQMVENQAVLVCQLDNQSHINIFTRLNQQWTLEQTIQYKGTLFGFQDSIPGRFVVKTNEGFAFIEKKDGMTWQFQNVDVQFDKKVGYFKKLIWIDANRAVVQRSNGQVDEFDFISRSSASADSWMARPLNIPADIKFGYSGSIVAFQNGLLVFSVVTDASPNPANLRLEIFSLDSQNILAHLQTLNLGQTSGARSVQVLLQNGFLYVSKPHGSGLGGADLSGRIEIFKYAAGQKLFEIFDTVLPVVTGQPAQALFGLRLAVNQDYLFATLNNQPAASQNGVLSTFVHGYALPR